MTVHSHKGYQGSIEYEDGQLVVQLLHLDDLITATCDSAADAETVFRELVEDYLATCKETGRPPNKPYKGSLNIRMPAELHRGLAMAASTAGISLNAWIVRACDAALSGPAPARYAESYPPARHVEAAKFHEPTLAQSQPCNVVDLSELRRINARHVRSA